MPATGAQERGGSMNREFYALERRRQRRRDLKAALALAIWAGGCYLLYVAWHARISWSERYADAIGTALYLVTFFYLFAFWPILTAVEKLFGGRRAPQEGASPTSAARSSAATARKAAGGDSSPGGGS
jgi:hypothetical protein